MTNGWWPVGSSTARVARAACARCSSTEVVRAHQVRGVDAAPAGRRGRRDERPRRLPRHARPGLLLRGGIRVLQEPRAERRGVEPGQPERHVARVLEGDGVRLAAEDQRLRLPHVGQVGGDEHEVRDGRVRARLGDHGAAVGVAHDDRLAVVDPVERAPQRGRIRDEAACHLACGRLAAGRQRQRAAADPGPLAQQLRRRSPPPGAVAHQGAVHDDQLHRQLPPSRSA